MYNIKFYGTTRWLQITELKIVLNYLVAKSLPKKRTRFKISVNLSYFSKIYEDLWRFIKRFVKTCWDLSRYLSRFVKIFADWFRICIRFFEFYWEFAWTFIPDNSYIPAWPKYLTKNHYICDDSWALYKDLLGFIKIYWDL